MSDLSADAYRDVLNDMLFEKFDNSDTGESVMWLGEGRWMIMNAEGPDVFVVELHRAKVEVVS